MPALEFTYQDTPWICNGWDALAPQFQLADAEALLDWIEAFSANTPLWAFLRAHFGIGPLIEDWEPYPNARQGANITCSGILSHDSALKGGERIYLPEWTHVENQQPIVKELEGGPVSQFEKNL